MAFTSGARGEGSSLEQRGRTLDTMHSLLRSVPGNASDMSSLPAWATLVDFCFCHGEHFPVEP